MQAQILAPRSVDTELEILIRARYPILYVVSWEEERVEATLQAIADRRNKKLVCWSAVRGLHAPSEPLVGGKRTFNSLTTDPMAALDEVMRQSESIIFLFKDMHPYLTDVKIVRRMRELAQHLKASPKTLILVSPSAVVPADLEKDITIVDYGLPTLTELGLLLDGIQQDVASHANVKVEVDDLTRERLLKAAQGLTLKEAENAFARTLIARGHLGEAEVSLILDEKKRNIRKSGILEYFDAQDQLEDVGGLGNLKEWVRKRTVAFTEQATSFGLPPPKGVLLLGVQGCGKSLCARAISQVWRLPLLRLDVGRIFSSYVGSSEANARAAISTAESVAPALLWIDEIEKSFAGGVGAGSVDAGTTSRVFSTFLTWLQEKTSPVFVIATANNIATLPPELNRKGRFDEIFFLDLPTQVERQEIFSIHLRRRGRNPSDFDLQRLSQTSDGYSGSEIEQGIVAALYDAFDRGQELTTVDVENSLRQSIPLSKTMKEELDALRQWADGRARMASERA